MVEFKKSSCFLDECSSNKINDYHALYLLKKLAYTILPKLIWNDKIPYFQWCLHFDLGVSVCKIMDCVDVES